MSLVKHSFHPVEQCTMKSSRVARSEHLLWDRQPNLCLEASEALAHGSVNAPLSVQVAFFEERDQFIDDAALLARAGLCQAAADRGVSLVPDLPVCHGNALRRRGVELIEHGRPGSPSLCRLLHPRWANSTSARQRRQTCMAVEPGDGVAVPRSTAQPDGGASRAALPR